MDSKKLVRGFALAAAALGLALGLALTLGGQGRAASNNLLGVRLGGDSQESRIVFDLDKAATAQLTPGAGSAKLTLEKIAAAAQSGEGQGLIRRWSVEPASGGARIEITLAEGAEVSRRFLLPPADGVANFRYVIDFKRKGAVAGPVVASRPAAANRPIVQAVVSTPPVREKKIIVIDAGHGGKDPGAIGETIQEKAVTLAAAKALRSELEKSGRYKVTLTRDTDKFIPLEERVAMARKAGADLFISLHADAGADSTRRGASVYTLSDQGAERVGRVMSQNDRLLANYKGTDRNVSRILLDLSQRATKNRSGAFAELLIARLGAETPLLARSHRDAGFVVLLAPDVPAVLLEMGFLTNPQDEKALSDPAKRGRMMAAAAGAIDTYFGFAPKVTAN